MKKTLALFVLLLISVGSMAQQKYQNDKSEPRYMYYQEMTQDEIINNINEINISLMKYCKMQVGGEITMIAGTAIAAYSSLVHYNNVISNSKYNRHVNAGMIIGSAAALTGYVIRMYSFSKIHKIQIQGSSVVYKF
jgi:hypothetical protein